MQKTYDLGCTKKCPVKELLYINSYMNSYSHMWIHIWIHVWKNHMNSYVYEFICINLYIWIHINCEFIWFFHTWIHMSHESIYEFGCTNVPDVVVQHCYTILLYSIQKYVHSSFGCYDTTCYKHHMRCYCIMTLSRLTLSDGPQKYSASEFSSFPLQTLEIRQPLCFYTSGNRHQNQPV